jgi:two-component sensor histidine kinase
MNHRVKNSLSMASSMLRLLNPPRSADEKLTRLLDEASMRILASARAHERLHQGQDIDTLDLGSYYRPGLQDLDEGGSCEITSVPSAASPWRSIGLCRQLLIITELVTNAAKICLS